MKRSKILSVVVALAASICLWIYVVTVVNPEDTVTISGIPVTFSGEDAMREDHDLIISDGKDLTVSLRITGKRSELRQLDASNISVVVDVSNVRTARRYVSNYTVVLPADVNESEISVVERNPGTITYTVERLAKKTIEVLGVFEGSPAEGYEIGTMEFDHDTIEISGSEEVLEPIRYAKVTINRTNLDTTVVETVSYTLINEDGSQTPIDDVYASVTEIEVTLPVSKLKDIDLVVNLIDGGGATDANAIVTIEPEKITISGDSTVVDGVNQISLGNIDLAQVNGEAVFEFPILIPNSAKNVSGEETATVTVTLRGLSTRRLRVGTIEFIGQTEGLTPTSLTSQLTVMLRGTPEELEQVTTNNIRAVADLSAYAQAGTFEVPVQIYVDGYPGVGAIEEKTITVSLAWEGDVTTTEPDPDESAEHG